MEKHAEYYQFSSSVNEGILEIIVTGDVPGGTFLWFHTELTAIIGATNVNFVLIDIRAVVNTWGIISAYLRTIGGQPNPTIAFVDHTEHSVFRMSNHIEAARNHVSFEWFDDIDAARVWLKSKQSK